MAFITLRQANVVNSPNAIIKGSPLSNSEVDNNFANLNLTISGVANALSNLSQSEISNGTSSISIVEDGDVNISLATGNIVLNSNVLFTQQGVFNNNTIANGSLQSSKLSNTGVSAGTYGSDITVSRITVGIDGRITEAANVSIVTGATLTDDTSSNATYYPALSNATTGSYTTAFISTTKLFFNPSTGILNATDFNSLSDAAFKTNLQQIQNPLSLLKEISGFEFNWIDSNRKSAGVIAQDVEKVLPHLVSSSNEGIKSVNYGSLTAYLIECVKELSNRIIELEKKNGS